MTPRTDADPAGAAAPRRDRRRLWIVLGVAVPLLAGLLGWLIDRAPNWLAQSIVQQYLQGLDIDTRGVDTIDVNVLTGEIAFGPVSFRGEDAERGRIERIGVDLDIARLFRRQALLEQVVIGGIRVEVRQDADGGFSINGVPLRRVLEERARPTAEAEDARRRRWGAGLNALELRDSEIDLLGPRGERATIRVDTLDLANFVSWTPEDPGRFDLRGTLNDIGIAMSGTATPFASTVAVDARLDVTGIDLATAAPLLAPLGIESAGGRIDLGVETRGSQVAADGSIDGRLQGTATLAGIDLAHASTGALRLSQATATLAGSRVLYDATGRVTVDGDLTLDLGEASVRAPDGTEVAFASAGVGLPRFEAVLADGAAPAVRLTPSLDVRGVRLGGPWVQGTAASTSIRIAALDVDASAPDRPMLATGTMRVDGLDLLLPLNKPITIAVGGIGIDFTEMRTVLLPERLAAEGRVGVEATDVAVSVLRRSGPDRPPVSLVAIGAGVLAATMPRFAFADGADGVAMAIASPTTSLQRLTLAAPVAPATEARIEADSLDVADIDVTLRDAADLLIAGRSRVRAPRLVASVGGGGGDGPSARATVSGLAADPRGFRYQEVGRRADLHYEGRIAAERIAAQIAARAADPVTTAEVVGLVLSAADLALDDLDAEAPQWRMRDLDLDARSVEARVPAPLAAMLEIRDVALADATAVSSPAEYGFDRLALGRVDVSLTRRPDAAGRAHSTPAATKPDAAGDARTWPPPGLPILRFGRFGLTDGGRITLLDQSVSPPVASSIVIERLALSDVDSLRPRSRSEMRLRARLDEAVLTAEGWALPFLPRPDFEARAAVADLLLPNLNAYLAPQIGLDVSDGRLNARADARADAGVVDGEIRAAVFGLRFSDRPAAEGDRITRSVGVPLSTIIDLLEDRDGSIRMTLPFEGDLLAPDFDYSEMIWDGVFRVLRALVLSPFELVSASVSLLAAAGDDAGAAGGGAAAATAPRLAPIRFAPATATLDADGRDATLALARVLADRPRLRLRFCAHTTAADAAALGAAPGTDPDPRLRRLAEDRMRAVRTHLSEAGVADPSQLAFCPDPRTDPSDPGAPRIEVGL